MASGNDPNAWLGLLKWSLSHQDGTEPSDVRSMSDENRQWLERVVSEGVRDDVKAMTEIYSRLCEYLDVTASEMHGTLPSEHQQQQRQEQGQVSPHQEVVGTATDQDDPSRASEAAVPIREGGSSPAEVALLPSPPTNAVLSTFLAPPVAPGGGIGNVGPTSSSSDHQRDDDAGDGAVGAGGSANTAGRGERLERVLDDLEELQEIVEQIDMAATFVKIGGFGRLIALVSPGYRPEKLRLRGASVVATLTKNNPPAQTEFSTSGGHKALLDAALGCDNRGVSEDGDTATSSSPASSRLSFALQRAILHALSCSVMGATAGEDELCKDARFQAFLAGALAQQGLGVSTADEGASTEEGGEGMDNEEGAKLRSKAAFVLKALVGAPGASVERVKALWPAILGLVLGLEEITQQATRGEEEDAEEGDGGITAVARETCIEAIVAAGRSADGARVVTELGSRVSMIMARRREVLVEVQNAGSGTRSEEDSESAEIELGLWLQWESLSGPAQ